MCHNIVLIIYGILIMKMKVIFLDIDGVLNTNSDREISTDKLKLLSELVSKTGADVVLSSSWRNWWNNPKINIPGSFITNWKKQFLDNNISITLTTELECPKNLSIEKFIIQHDVTCFVVLDDEPIDTSNLVQTNGDIGLTQLDFQKAAHLLK